MATISNVTSTDKKKKKDGSLQSMPSKEGEKPTPGERIGKALGGAAGDMGEAIGAGVGYAVEGVKNFGSGFSEGLSGVEAAPPDPTPQPTPTADRQAAPAAAPEQRPMKDIAGQHAVQNGQPAGDAVSAAPGNMQDIEGLQDVKYAGQYGDTDVYGKVTLNDDGTQHGQFSDFDNIGTLEGGPAAPLPDNGNPVASGNSTNIAGKIASTPGGAGMSLGGAGPTSAALQQARSDAVARGDYDGALRSYMSEEERNAVDARERRDRLVDAAGEQDPLGTVKALDANDAAQKDGADQYRAAIEKELAEASTAKARQAASIKKSVFDKLTKQVAENTGEANDALVLRFIEQIMQNQGGTADEPAVQTAVQQMLAQHYGDGDAPAQQPASAPVNTSTLNPADEAAYSGLNAGV